jgi:hypothetical protein
MSDMQSENISLFRIDLERAFEALSLALKKKPKTTKNIVPYCFDLSNALDGLSLSELSLAAGELANIFQTSATGKLGLEIIEEFQALVQLSLQQNAHPNDEIPHGLLEKNTLVFFKKLHEIAPSAVTERYLSMYPEEVIEDAIQTPEEEQPPFEDGVHAVDGVSTSLSPKYLSVQEMLNQELEPADSEKPITDIHAHEVFADEPVQVRPDSPSHSSAVADASRLIDSLEASINQLDSIVGQALDVEKTENVPQAQSEITDEPFFIDFPFSKANQAPQTIEQPTSHIHPSEALQESNRETDEASLEAAKEAFEASLRASISSASGLPPETESVGEIESQRLDQPIVSSHLANALASNPNDHQELESVPEPITREATGEIQVDSIEDPLAELSKLTEQFSLAAKSLKSSRPDPVDSPELERQTQSPPVIVLPLAKATSVEKEKVFIETPKPFGDGMTLADLQQVPSINPSVAEVKELNLEEQSAQLGSRENINQSQIEEKVGTSSWGAAIASPVESKPQVVQNHFDFNLQKSLNRLQHARGLLGTPSAWQLKELDRLIEDQQNTMTQSIQISLGQAFRGLAEAVDVEDLFADPDIVQRVLSVLSILPVQQSISAVQQHLLIFIDLIGGKPTDRQLHLAGGFLAQICGSIEVRPEMIRITIPTSLMRMQVHCYKRHEDLYAVPLAQLVESHQFTHEEAATDSTMWDVHGAIDGPHHRIQVRCGSTDHSIYCFETVGNRSVNLFVDIPAGILKPTWLGGIGVDGQNQLYHCVFFDRYVE